MNAVPGKVAYYISMTGCDANNCSAAAPCRSINSVNARLGSSLPAGAAGTVIHVSAGVYDQAVIDKSGTTSGRIRYISDARWGAKIVTSGVGESFKNYGSYVDIVGFDISGDVTIGMDNQGSYTRILGNRVHDIALSRGCVAGAGIYSGHVNYRFGSTPVHNEIAGNWVYNVGRAQTPCKLLQGIYFAGPYGSVVNNVAAGNAGWGVHLWHAATNVVVANNTVCHNGAGGILVGCGDDGCRANDYTTVVNNIVANSLAGYGISENGPTGSHNVYRNNLAFNNPAGAFALKNSLQCALCLMREPGFADSQTSDSAEYHLAPGSSAIDSGASVNAPTIDFSGGARPVGSAWDIGAHEFGAAPAVWPWY